MFDARVFCFESLSIFRCLPISLEQLKRAMVNRFFFFLLLLLTLPQALCNRLSTDGRVTLTTNENDTLVSPTGLYRVHLLTNCSLAITKYNQTSVAYQPYIVVNSPRITAPAVCSNLTLNKTQRGLTTNDGLLYLQLDPQKQYDLLALKIDESAKITLYGDYKGSEGDAMDMVYLPNNLNSALRFVTFSLTGNASAPSPNLLNSLLVGQNLTQTNRRGWNFGYNQNGNLTISKGNISRTFNLAGITITQHGIIDAQKEQTYAVVPGMTLHPRAGPATCVNPHNLFYKIDDYYPVMRFYDDQKYQVLEYGLKEPQGQPTVYCPKGTFRYQGECKTLCPSFFLKEIRHGQGQCVLTCESGSTIIGQVCTSINFDSGIVQKTDCPTGSVAYEFGCRCTAANKFYDSQTNNCSDTCPNYTIALGGEGICAPCPPGCSKCQVDSNSLSYLACTRQDPKKVCQVANCNQCSLDGKTCLECNPFFTLTSPTSCVPKCADRQLFLLDQAGVGYCLNLTEGTPSDYVGGVYNANPYLVRKTQCADQKQVIQQSQCLSKCKAGFKLKEGTSICVCQGAGETFFNGACQNLTSPPSGFYYNRQYETYLNCPVGCASCSEKHCLSCAPGNVLVVSTGGSTCRRNSALFACDAQYFHYDQNTLVCTPKNLAVDANQCILKQNGSCVRCNHPWVLGLKDFKLECLEACPAGSFNRQGFCVQNQDKCIRDSLVSTRKNVVINSQTLDSDVYNSITNGGVQISNDPAIEIFTIRRDLDIAAPSTGINSFVNAFHRVCLECQKGFIVFENKCQPVDGPNGNFSIPSCLYKLLNGKCVDACPAESTPIKRGDQLICETKLKGQPDRLRLDAAVYPYDLSDSKKEVRLFYFVIDEVLKDNPYIRYYEINNNQRLRQTQATNSIIKAEPFRNKTYIAIESTADEVILDFRNSTRELQSLDGSRLGNGVYGVENKRSHTEYTRNWLAIVSFTISIILIILHAIYIGNNLLYKVDNALIFAQGLYFFSFINLMVGRPIAQYYYGFLWSHFGFFPNYFAGTIPSRYYEGYPYGNAALTPDQQYVPNSYRLQTGDANFIRNAGYAFSLLATFLVALLVVVVMIQILRKVCGKFEIWYHRIARQAFFAGIEFVCMAIVYWAVAHLLYNQGRAFTKLSGEPASHTNFRRGCSIAAIVFISLYVLYAIIRWCFNSIGGLYTFKRIAVAVILAASTYETIAKSSRDGVIGNKAVVIALIATELIFMVLRFILESPYLRRQKFYILAEAIAIIAAYLIMYFWNDTGVISIYVSIVLFLFILLFIEDLIDVYNDSRDQFYEDYGGIVPGSTQKPVTKSNEKDWAKLSREQKRNENYWTRNKIHSRKVNENDLRYNEHPPSTERMRLAEGKDL